MLAFIIVVLVIGALLSCIFGKGIGQLFVLGTGTIILLGIGVLLVLLSPLIWDYFHETAPVGHVDMQTYQPTYGTAAYPTTDQAQPSRQDQPSDQAQPNYQASDQPTVASSPVAPPPPPGGPSMGITTQPADPRLSAQFAMGAGYGATVVSVAPGGPAAQAGLAPGDFVQAMDYDPITADHTLADYEAAKGAGQAIRLSVQHNDGSRWVHEWVKVTPR